MLVASRRWRWRGDADAHLDPGTHVIAHLRGRLFEKHPNRLVVDVNGVGYDVFMWAYTEPALVE